MSEMALIDGLASGFADETLQAQAAFRLILDAMARPGRIQRLTQPALAPQGLSPAAASVLAALADGDTPVHVPATPALRGFVAGRLGAPLAGEGEAAFAVVAAAGLLPLTRFAAGSDAMPDQSATVIVEVSALGSGPVLSLRGPGIREVEQLAVEGLPEGFAAAWAAQRALFPRGVDLVLCCGDRLAALPRSTRIV
ncbi:phosphonate C-P lyase system protein PhnH [Zavarzinia aquatilis]|uniref:Phosphonate C-P lyase system protein PhnH n=1 Tax=Zavarzinia aquatilis TaxID=2211142 RepID=A0A317E5H1_9PROT|nr:phosphonate C-P lyase system protein PhnH [Zavarzinia aquatilis]PWR21430.1 phosphonate C-P lyase system protein PhnH [Zavarzinia aquatilis]